MTLETKENAIAAIGIDAKLFDQYEELNVFSSLTRPNGRGRPKKNGEQNTLYDVDTLRVKIDEFKAGKIPEPLKKDGPPSSFDGVKVVRIGGKDEPKEFDYKILGDISSRKKLKKRILELTATGEVPSKIMKDLRTTFKMLNDERTARLAQRKRIPIEQHESACQKVFDEAMGAWKIHGEEAAQIIVDQINAQMGKPIQRECPMIAQIIHRAICDVNNRVIQPEVLKVLAKI